MLCRDILLHYLGIDLPVGNVLIDLVQMLTRTAQRPMMLVVPILKLYPVNVATVQESHLLLYHSIHLFRSIKSGNETITWKTCPVTGYIYGNSTKNNLCSILFCTVYIHQITGIIGCRSSPSPSSTDSSLLRYNLVHCPVADFSSGRKGVSCKRNTLARPVTCLVGSEIDRQVRGDWGYFRNPSTLSASTGTATGIITLLAACNQQQGYHCCINYLLHLL